MRKLVKTYRDKAVFVENNRIIVETMPPESAMVLNFYDSIEKNSHLTLDN